MITVEKHMTNAVAAEFDISKLMKTEMWTVIHQKCSWKASKTRLKEIEYRMTSILSNVCIQK